MIKDLWKKLLGKLQSVHDEEEEFREEDLEDRELIIDQEDKKQRIAIRGKFPKFYWAVIANVLLFAVLAALYVVCGSHIYSPKTAVEEYYAAYAEGDWNKSLTPAPFRLRNFCPGRVL